MLFVQHTTRFLHDTENKYAGGSVISDSCHTVSNVCVNMYRYIYVYLHLDLHIHSCLRTYLYMYTHSHTYLPTYLYVSTYLRTHVRTYVRTCVRACVRTCMRTYVRACRYVRTSITPRSILPRSVPLTAPGSMGVVGAGPAAISAGASLALCNWPSR